MKLMLVDGNNLVMRAVFAMSKSGLSHNGVETGPLLAFVNSLSRHIAEERPTNVIVCWDHGRSRFRLALDPLYKVGRRTEPSAVEAELDKWRGEVKSNTFDLCREFLGLAHVQQYSLYGFEADDIIAAYCQRVWDVPDAEAVIISSDKDFLQLLSPKIYQIRMSTGKAEADKWDVDRVRRDVGCEPYQVPYAMALAGDAGDDVPGVKGFGMKTAIKHLNKHGWDLEAVDHPRVVEARDQVRRAFALVDLRTPRDDIDPPLVEPFKPVGVWDPVSTDLVEWLNLYAMETTKRRFLAGTLWTVAE
jgi:DNA polymerase-1